MVRTCTGASSVGTPAVHPTPAVATYRGDNTATGEEALSSFPSQVPASDVAFAASEPQNGRKAVNNVEGFSSRFALYTGPVPAAPEVSISQPQNEGGPVAEMVRISFVMVDLLESF